MNSSFFTLARTYRRNADASIPTIFSITAPFVLLVVGTTYDTSQITNMKGQAQLVADVIGLNASVYVKNNGGPPTKENDGFLHNQWYNANEMDLNFGDGIKNGNKTRFKVSYDDIAEEAVVQVESSVVPVFMQAFGYANIEFTTLSTVKYAKKAYSNPASIFLVIDNSGSMAFDDIPMAYYYGPQPLAAKPRIDGLKTELQGFSDHLAKVIVPNPDEPNKKYLRMGMTAFNADIINARTVSPFWGTISNSDISSLDADGGTVPTQALAKVQSWMNGEDSKHKTMNGNAEPLKYVVMMADGANNSTYDDTQSLKHCTALKDAGVEIFTIGFALEPGYFYTGVWGQRYNSPIYYISPTVKDRAQTFLNSCASSDNHFLLAENADALKAAFDKIGALIVEDAIRVSK